MNTQAKTSKAAQRATTRYKAKTLERLAIEIIKGQKDIIREHAEGQNESLNAFVKRAIAETMERDNKKVADSTPVEIRFPSAVEDWGDVSLLGFRVLEKKQLNDE
jgi:hypothetical protein